MNYKKVLFTKKDGTYIVKSKKEVITLSNSNHLIKKLIINNPIKNIMITHGYTIEEVNFNDELHTIGYDSFENSKIEDLILPQKLESIQDGAFFSCTLLKNITFNSFPSIETTSFYRCTNIKNITFNINDKSLNIDIPNGYEFGGIETLSKDIRNTLDEQNIYDIYYKNDYEEIHTYINKNLDYKKVKKLTDINKYLKDGIVTIPEDYEQIIVSPRDDNNKYKVIDFSNINTDNIMFSHKVQGYLIGDSKLSRCIVDKFILPPQNKSQKIHFSLDNVSLNKIEIPSNKTNYLEQYSTVYSIEKPYRIELIYNILDNYIICLNKDIYIIIDSNGEVYVRRIDYEKKLDDIKNLNEIIKQGIKIDNLEVLLNKHQIPLKYYSYIKKVIEEYINKVVDNEENMGIVKKLSL